MLFVRVFVNYATMRNDFCIEFWTFDWVFISSYQPGHEELYKPKMQRKKWKTWTWTAATGKKLYRTLNNNPTGHTKTLPFHIFIWFWTSHQKILSYKKKKHKVKNIKTWQLYKWTWQELWKLWNLHSSRVWRSL